MTTRRYNDVDASLTGVRASVRNGLVGLWLVRSVGSEIGLGLGLDGTTAGFAKAASRCSGHGSLKLEIGLYC